jgi:uncharacterized protein (DUF427 family)
MTLTIGTGPFGESSTGQFNFEVTAPKDHVLYMEESPRRVRAVFNGQIVADSRRAKLMHESGLLPLYYLPEEDLNAEILEPTDHSTHCPYKGDASYRSVRVGDRIAENAVWHYPEPLEGAPPLLKGHAAIYWKAMDHWYEEDEEVFVHARDPYHRVDVLQSSRHVRVSVNGETIAETQRPRILFETGLPPRYYIPPEDVNPDLLQASDTQTDCPYKGRASYHSVIAGSETAGELVWYYPDPIPAAAAIKDHLCFYNEKVDLEVDGESQERPRTPFS